MESFPTTDRLREVRCCDTVPNRFSVSAGLQPYLSAPCRCKGCRSREEAGEDYGPKRDGFYPQSADWYRCRDQCGLLARVFCPRLLLTALGTRFDRYLRG